MQDAIHYDIFKKAGHSVSLSFKFLSYFMIVFEISHTDNKTLLQSMAAVMNIPYNGEDYITLHPPEGKGIIKILDIADELQVLLADATFSRDLLAIRKPSEKRYYILHFDDLYVKDTARFSVDGDTLLKNNIRHSVARLTSNAFSNTEEIAANTPFKTVKVFFSEAWLLKYLGLGPDEAGLQKYVSLKTASFDIEPLDAEYLQLMDELWHTEKDWPLQNVFLQNRVTMLIERFFTRLSKKMKYLENKCTLTKDEMERLVKVEQFLIKDFSKPPATIEELAKMIAMSSTKLKKCFKAIYGNSIYAYYQTMRLQKAKEILASGKCNVNETAYNIGYINTSNFILAFKKQFKQLPSELLQ